MLTIFTTLFHILSNTKQSPLFFSTLFWPIGTIFILHLGSFCFWGGHAKFTFGFLVLAFLKKKIQIILLENRRGNYWNIHYCLLYQGNNEDPLGKLVLNCKILMPVKLLNNITHLFIHTYFKKLQQLYSNFSTQLQHYSNFSTKEPSVIVNILNSVTTLLMLLKIYSLW